MVSRERAEMFAHSHGMKFIEVSATKKDVNEVISNYYVATINVTLSWLYTRSREMIGLKMLMTDECMTSPP